MGQVAAVGAASHNENATTGASIAVLRNGIIAGNCIVVAVTVEDLTTITNVSDGTIVKTVPDIVFDWSGGAQRLAIFSFPSHPGGNKTFTANFAATQTFRGIDVLELSGADPVAPLDQTVSAQGNSAAPMAGIITPSVDGSYIVGFCLSGNALTADAAFADLFNDPTVLVSDLEGLAQERSASIAVKWTQTAATWGAIAACYRPPRSVQEPDVAAQQRRR